MSYMKYVPTVKSIPNDKMRELVSRYGEVDIFDATPFVTGLTDNFPKEAACGCGFGRFIKNRLERAREEYLENVDAGRNLFALLGRLECADDGPLTVLRFDNGSVVIAIPPDVCATNPTMTIRNGVVDITGGRAVDSSFHKPGQPTNPFLLAADRAQEARSRFRLVESNCGGTTITMNSLHSADYSVVHLKSMCSMWKAEKRRDSATCPEGGSRREPHLRRRSGTVSGLPSPTSPRSYTQHHGHKRSEDHDRVIEREDNTVHRGRSRHRHYRSD